MDLETLIGATSCLIDETLPTILAGRRLRQRGPQPILADSEVLTMEVIGEFLGHDQDQAIFQYFRQHFAHCFPALTGVHRTTFVRQAATLWKLKELLWKRLVAEDWEPVSLVDRVPIAVCAFPRARWCRRFAGEASSGRDYVARQTVYGFRLHVRCAQSGLIEAISLAAGELSDLAVLPDIAPPGPRLVVADRNYWSPLVTEDLARDDVTLWAPFRSATYDPTPERSVVLGRLRRRIETTFAQLVERD